MKNIIKLTAKWILIFFIISIFIFMIVRLLPVSPEKQWLSSYNMAHTKENIEIIKAKMGLDKPLLAQYFYWIRNFLIGDWGYSLSTHVSIRDQFQEKILYSITIGILGIVFAAFGSFFIGYRAAIKRGGFFDRFSAALAVISQSVPSFITAIIIIYFFSVKLRLVRFFTGSAIYAMIAAISIVAIYSLGVYSRIVLSAFREEMSKSYIRFAVSRGMHPNKVLMRYASKPVLCKLIGAVIANFASVFGGSTVLEFAFGIPGISLFLVDSMKKSDYNVLQTYILVVVIWMFFVHLVLDFVLDRLDVRRR